MQVSKQYDRQRRQILTLMGITHWVRRDSRTITVADLSANDQLNGQSQSAASRLAVSCIQQQNQPQQALPNTDSNDAYHSACHDESETHQAIPTHVHPNIDTIDEMYATTNTAADVGSQSAEPVTANITSTGVSQLTQVEATATVPQASCPQSDPSQPTIPKPSTPQPSRNCQTVAAFTLSGIHYGQWVLLVDVGQMDTEASQLWHNICVGLSQQPERLSFPLCQGMDDVALANATLAGFIFKLAKVEQVRVASLTTLVEGLDDERLLSVPRLDEMLRQPMLKRQLWQLLQTG